jgi:hypothetical protein
MLPISGGNAVHTCSGFWLWTWLTMVSMGVWGMRHD